MKTICTVEGAVCPRKLDTCCGACEFRMNCKHRCTSEHVDNYEACPEVAFVNDELTALESVAPEAIQQMTTLIRVKKELDEREKQLKNQLVKAMEHFNIKSFENDKIKITYVAPTTRSTIDSAKLKKDHPDLAEQYTKVSGVSASVRVVMK